jgi:class 3 adenylate cyclase/tetratricopeptide (TPR) repeat protein
VNCTKCSYVNPKGAKFCIECGTALMERAADKSVHLSERKRITALFSDLTGYTAMTGKLDPEEVKEITSRIFDGTRAIIKKYEGFIERFAGDGFLALFGVPKAHEDDPIRAIRAALEIHRFVESLNPLYQNKVGRTLTMHSGINTGLAVTADADPEKGTHGVTGEAVNLGARLSDLADAGDILVGEETYRASRERFAFEALKPVKVKGKSDPIAIYRLVSDNASLSYVGSGRQVFSQMVGRDRELAKLELQVVKAIKGEGSVVNVIGEAGIGKSRLMAELKKREVMQRITLLEGRAISIGRNLSFYPVIDLLKQWARITEDDSEIQAFDKLDHAIRNVHPTETDEILPFVATLMGLKLRGRYAERVKGIEGEALEKLIIKNFRDLIVKSSELSPMVIVTEDLHWSDDSSLALLQSLYRLTEKNRLLFVNVFRPGYLEAEGTKTTAMAHETIEIQPLAKTDSEALIHNMIEIKGLSFSLKEQILNRAGGNPFFIEEVVRSLIDDGTVIRGTQGFEVTDKINQVVIPPTINDVLMARIDRLEEQTRNLVKVASVIGRSFFDRILKDVADSIDGVDDRLSYLKDVQLIRERKRLQELEYLFNHALAQEAAYESTLIQQRKALHLKVAQSIEKIFTERLHEFYGMLAHHYGLAGDGEKTEEYLIKAGEEALKSSASSEALNYLQEALKLYIAKYGANADPDKLATLEKNIALAYHNKARYKEAMRYFDTALKRYGMPIPKYRPTGIAKALWGFLVLLKVCYFKLPGPKKSPTTRDYEAFEICMRAGEASFLVDPKRCFIGTLDFFRRTAKFSPRTPRIPGYWSAFCTSLITSGIVPFRIYSRLLEISKRYIAEQDTRSNLNILVAESQSDRIRGKWGTINELDQDILKASLGIGEFWFVSVYWRWYGFVKLEQGEFASAKEVQNKLYEIGETYDQSFSILVALVLKTSFLIMIRSAQEAISVADEGICYARGMDNIIYEIMLLGGKAEAQQLAGDTDGAQDSLLQTSELHKKQPFISPYYYVPYLASRFSVDIEQIKQAKRLSNSENLARLRNRAYKTGKTALRNSRKFAPYRTKIFRLLGEYFWQVGKQGKAFKWWKKAIREGERLGARPDLSRTYFEVGKRLMEPHSKHKKLNGIDAKGYLEKAAVLFEELGFDRYFEELEAIRSSA